MRNSQPHVRSTFEPVVGVVVAKSYIHPVSSVIPPERIDQFWCAWCQSLAFFKLYMIHVKKLKIDQEKPKLWSVEVRCIFYAPHSIYIMDEIPPLLQN